MLTPPFRRPVFALLAAALVTAATTQGEGFSRVEYNHPGLVVDLGVGLWAQPLPMDYDGDGDPDLVVATADKPYNGVYFFENKEGNVRYPVFEPGVRLDDAQHNTTVSYVHGSAHVLRMNEAFPNFRESAFAEPAPIAFEPDFYAERARARQWKYVDFDGDGVTDLIIGASDWTDYGWDDAYNEQGDWVRGPLHGYVYFVKNHGTEDAPAYRDAVQLQTVDGPIDVYGAPSPNFADWDGDGDLDLICGEFLDRITYFENIGTRTEPVYAKGRFLTHMGETIRMDLEMLQVVAFDWDGDGDMDLVVGQEDGRVALLECTGLLNDGTPRFELPRFFQQKAHFVKIGALCTPSSVDWDGDGDVDIIAGDTAGYLNFVENLDGGNPPTWAEPVYLKAGGVTIRVQAGPNGSIQGPAEAKWGYTAPSVADWNHDGLPDIVINSIWGKVEWFENVGSRTAPALRPAQAIEVEWDGPTPKPAWNWWNPEGKELVTQWRTTPMVYDWNGDGLNDLVMLDHEGYLAFFERTKADGALKLLPGKRIFFNDAGELLRLNERNAGGSGRRKFTLADWDQDGKIDILINSKNIDLLRNISTEPGRVVFKAEGNLTDDLLAGHTTSPTTVDWDQDGVPDILAGAEDGHLYHLQNPHGTR